MRILPLLLMLAWAAPTHAQTLTNPVAIPVGTPGVLIPGNPQYRSIRWQAQGAGYACVSWNTGAIAISGNTAAATCTGSGAYLVTAGDAEGREYPMPLPGAALYGVAASGAVLQLVFEVQ